MSDSVTIRMQVNVMSNIFRKIVSLPAFAEIDDTELLKYVDTRFGSGVLMGRRLLVTRSIYRNLMVDTKMNPTGSPTEVQRSQQCYPDAYRLLEEPGSVLSDLRAIVASFARQ